MKCVVCKHGETRPGTTTVTFDRGGFTMVFRGVPAELCDNCGEAYVDEATSHRLTEEFERAVASGRLVDVRDYVAA